MKNLNIYQMFFSNIQLKVCIYVIESVLDININSNFKYYNFLKK